jgi:predicted transcriptional regulator of viral defense system
MQGSHDTPGLDHGCIFAVATGQMGYFTAAQARDCGFSWDLLTRHAQSGRFIRIRRGFYRLRDYPPSPNEDVMAAWLSAGRDAIGSHESALDLLGLSDVIPDAIHLTVPRQRRYAQHRSGIAVHTTSRELAPVDVMRRQGLPVTSATRSILDSAQYGTGPEQIAVAERDEQAALEVINAVPEQ